jgi:glutaryl-CoA dehydrogenase
MEGLAAGSAANPDRADRRSRAGGQPTAARPRAPRTRTGCSRHRNAVAWAALGPIAIDYCTPLTQFGKPWVSVQIVQDGLVKMLAELCSTQLYCLRLCRLMVEGQLTDTIAAMNNTRKAREVVAEARDLLGGNGILLDSRDAALSDVQAPHTYEGTKTSQTSSSTRITDEGSFA